MATMVPTAPSEPLCKDNLSAVVGLLRKASKSRPRAGEGADSLADLGHEPTLTADLIQRVPIVRHEPRSAIVGRFIPAASACRASIAISTVVNRTL